MVRLKEEGERSVQGGPGREREGGSGRSCHSTISLWLGEVVVDGCYPVFLKIHEKNTRHTFYLCESWFGPLTASFNVILIYLI